jgi:1-pyrroline-4-hydroxy-2-carboxylate deaminase
VGRGGGPCRPPRVPLMPAQEAEVRTLTEQAVAAGMT